MQIEIVPVQVQCVNGIRTMYDLCINGRAIEGARCFKKAEAEQERTIMYRSPVWKNAQVFMR